MANLLRLTFCQFQLGDRFRMHFIRTIRQSQRADIRPGAGQECVVGNARATERLNGTIEHAQTSCSER